MTTKLLTGLAIIALAATAAAAQTAPVSGVNILLTRKSGEPVVIATSGADGRFRGRAAVRQGEYSISTACPVTCPPHALTSVSVNGSRVAARRGAYSYLVGPNTRSLVVAGEIVAR